MSDEDLERIELTTYGYIREFETNHKLSNIVPDQLKDVIVMFYPRVKFKFIGQFENNDAKIENDGAKLTIINGSPWILCRIGNFFDMNDKLVHKITLISYDGEITGCNSIGFLTKELSEFILPSYNPGNNGSMYISSNGYFATSKCFDPEMKNHATFIHANEHAMGWDQGWYKENDLVMIKIDTSKMKAIAWNSTPNQERVKGRTDLDVDKEYEDYKGFYFKFDLPKDIPVAFFIELGTEQSVEIIDHAIQYIQ